ncbi:5905_t:CDS:2, partial [Dentiscutata heterogama]
MQRYSEVVNMQEQELEGKNKQVYGKRSGRQKALGKYTKKK